MIIGHTPMLMTSGTRPVGSQGISPNRFHREVGSAADRSWIQPKKGAWRLSMVTKRTFYRSTNTGIWMIIGRQPDAGLAFSRL